jgi:undecaprenyl-diphosphatase
MRTIVESITRWDTMWVMAIFGLNSRRTTATAMRWVSRTGDGYAYPLLAALLLIAEPVTGRMFLAAALAAFALELPAYKLSKRWVKRVRPFGALPGVQGRVRPQDTFSFPSGHTAAAFVMATLLGHAHPWLFPAAGLWATAVGFSRIYLGVHYPTDVMAGIALGVTSACCGIAVAGMM